MALLTVVWKAGWFHASQEKQDGQEGTWKFVKWPC